jgi:hypothetical protein
VRKLKMVCLIQNLFKIQSCQEIDLYNELKWAGGRVELKSTFPGDQGKPEGNSIRIIGVC